MPAPVPPARNRPLVALVGRTNVGKSSLWNRLTETGQALVSPQSHTTRDRKYGQVVWRGVVFDLIDTGGMDTEANEIGEGIRTQTIHALKEADLLLFMMDGQSGVLPQDQEIARVARETGKPVWLLVNKIDQMKHASMAHDPAIYQLALGEPKLISANTGFLAGDLLDEILTELERQGKPAVPTYEVEPLKLALVGRPNVGKSSLVNSILGENRVIVSPVAHTTREPQDTWLRYQDRDVMLVDTAGMRKQARVDNEVEEAGIERNMKAIDECDVACLVFDVTQDPTAQDRHLAGILETSSKGLILVANKWDLIPDKKPDTANGIEMLIRQLFPFLSWAPMVFVSAKQNMRTRELLDMAMTVQSERHRKIDYNAINRLLKACIKSKKPLPSYGPKSPRIYDVAQVREAPPTFLITILGEKESVHENWVRFFEKRIREKFGFKGTPIIVKARNVPTSKGGRKWNKSGPGYEEAVGKIIERKPVVNQTRRRQKT
ncbi:ribosome biogenesis GTPase Der [Patescibacteria group bacterium]|nr:ribosome biogenesis GTPase Der [Patescibacteria group bacterium]MBP9709799.1 ribosome biogenesis GTPase Der [Patescibacteria group bacterium]